MADVAHIKVLIAMPNDALPLEERVKEALEKRWWGDFGQHHNVALEPTSWKRDKSMPYHDEGRQGGLLAGPHHDAEVVVVLFNRRLGTPWPEEATDNWERHHFRSGTDSEIMIGRDQRKYVRVFATSSAWQDDQPHPDGPYSNPDAKFSGPTGRQVELQEYLQQLEQDSFPVLEFDRMDDLLNQVCECCSEAWTEGWIDTERIRPASRAVASWPIQAGVPLGALPLPVDYVERAKQYEVEQAWADGNCLVALTGFGGFGKTMIARHLYHKASQAKDADVMIWINQATPATAIEAYADAAEKLGRPDPSPQAGETGRRERLAKALVDELSKTRGPWLVVIDNLGGDTDAPEPEGAPPAGDIAEVDSLSQLIDEGLLPAPTPRGRILVTARTPSEKLASVGFQVKTDVFTPDEVLAFLRHPHASRNIGATSSRFQTASDSELSALGEAVDRIPVALAIAVATIEQGDESINHWVQRLQTTGVTDRVFKASDPAGYRFKINQVVHLALAQAGHGFPAEAVKRAALVAACLDPAGHPGWIWEDADLLRWIYDDAFAPEPDGVKPDVVHQLQRYGFIEVTSQTEGEPGWPNVLVRMHGLIAQAIQGPETDETLEEVTLHCADALLGFDRESAKDVRLTATSMVALLIGRGREGLILHDEDGSWTHHDVLQEVLDAALFGYITQLPVEDIERGLQLLLPEKSGSLAGLRAYLIPLAQWERKWRFSEQLLLLLSEVDRESLHGSWGETLAVLDATFQLMPMIEAFQVIQSGRLVEAQALLRRFEEQIDGGMMASSSYARQTLFVTRIQQILLDDSKENRDRLSRSIDELISANEWDEQYQLLVDLLPKELRREVTLTSPELGPGRASFTERLAHRKDLTVDGLARLSQEVADRTGSTSTYAMQVAGDYCSAMYDAGRVDEACQLALSTYNNALESDSCSPLNALDYRSQVAVWTSRAGDDDAAIRLLQGLLPDYINVFGPANVRTLRCWSNLAWTLVKAKRWSEGAQALSELIHLRSESPGYGPVHPETLEARRWHAQCVAEAGEPGEAAGLFAQLADTYRDCEDFGPAHRETLTARHQQAHWLWQDGCWDESIELMRQVLADRREYLGDLDSDTIASVSYLASCWKSLSKWPEATQAYEELARLRSGSPDFGPVHPDTLNSRYWQATSIGRAGDAGEAARFFSELADTYRDCEDFGSAHRETLKARHQQAHWLWQDGCWDESIELMRQVLADKREYLGDLDSDTIASVSYLASCWKSLSKWPEATQAYEELVRLRSESPDFDPIHPDTLDAWYWHAESVGKAGDADVAARLFGELAEVYKEQSGLISAVTLKAQSRQAYWLGEADHSK